MELNLTFFIFATVATLFAGVSKGGFGSGAAFASTPILAVVVSPEIAIGLMLPLLIIMDISSLKFYWKKWSWLDAKLLIIGGLPGIFIGFLLFSIINSQILRLLIGFIALGFVLFSIFRSKFDSSGVTQNLNISRTIFLGFLSGFTSFISHAGGPTTAVHLLNRGLSKLEYQATTVVVFWWLNIVKVLPYAFLGMFSAEVLRVNVFLFPIAIAGTWLGVLANRIISEQVFFLITYILLTLTGIKLIFDGLSSYF